MPPLVSKPLIIYLDQNKWIQIARLIHGTETDAVSYKNIEKLIQKVKEGKVIVPLSAIHFLETQRIRDKKRRKILGNLMWELSTGHRIISVRGLVTYEIKFALHEIMPRFPKPSLKYIDYGLEHAFGMSFDKNLPDTLERMVEKSALTGETPEGAYVPPYLSTEFKENFSSHLSKIAKIDHELPEGNWRDYLSAVTIMDILSPLNDVFLEYDLKPSEFGSRQFCENLISKMPTRLADIHMHTQFFKNKHLKPKLNDLEDWAALLPASIYCNHVVCEKHFANLITRDNFKTHASLHTDLSFIDAL